MGAMAGATKRQATGFTLIELLVVVAIMMVLIGMVMGAISIARQQQRKVLAAKQVHDICSAAESYFMMMHQYPVDTGLVESNGSTNPFPTTPADPAEANAIYMYLGRKIYEPESATKFGNFLMIHLLHLQTLGTTENVMVDPWGMPYCMDSVHVSMTEGSAVTGDKIGYVAREMNVQRMGAPYNSSVPLAQQVLPVKVWSSGPDKKDGTVVFSHVQAPTEPEDGDNIASWR